MIPRAWKQSILFLRKEVSSLFHLCFLRKLDYKAPIVCFPALDSEAAERNKLRITRQIWPWGEKKKQGFWRWVQALPGKAPFLRVISLAKIGGQDWEGTRGKAGGEEQTKQALREKYLRSTYSDFNRWREEDEIAIVTCSQLGSHGLKPPANIEKLETFGATGQWVDSKSSLKESGKFPTSGGSNWRHRECAWEGLARRRRDRWSHRKPEH